VKINLLETEEDDARIEILPLIDVIFCILTFFIMASLTLTRQQAINLDLPKASTGVAQNRELKIVSIAPNGQLFMDKQPTDQTRLVESLKAYMKAQPNGLIVLNASPTVSYNQVIQVLDLLRSVGGQRVALATQPADRPALSEPQPTPFQSPGTFIPENMPGIAPNPGGSPPGPAAPGPSPVDPANPGAAPAPVDPNVPPPPPSTLETP
jgi:biopolymer transport protein ExbD